MSNTTSSPASGRSGPAAIVGVLLLVLLAACTPASGEPAADTGADPGAAVVACPNEQPASSGALILLVGVHANAPRPDVPAMLACEIRTGLQAGNPVSVVALDGDPAAVDTIRFASTAKNDAAIQDDMTEAENRVLSAVRGAQATSDGSDLVAGLNVAADLAASQGSQHARIVVIDSGLPDRGALNMTTPGMIGADPAEVADFLADQRALDKLAGMTVDLVGVGYTTSPQQSLTPWMVDNVTAILRKSLTAAGASVRVRPAPRTAEALNTTFVTTPAPLPATPEFTPNRTTVYDDASALGFLPDTTVLRDPAAARTVVADLAAWLTTDPGRRASIMGTCASDGTKAGRKQLSQQRAEQIKALLTDLGVAPDQVTTVGAGYIADPRDRRPDGSFDPANAALNRSVRITATEAS